MGPISFHGNSALISILIILVLTFGITVSTIHLKNSSELEYCKRINSIVKAEIEQSNRNEILGVGEEN